MILPMARLRTLSQVTQLRIGEEDLLRGFIDVECGSCLEIRSNSRCRIAFSSKARWFNAVHVYGFPRAIEFGPEGGAYLRPFERHRSATYRLSYRFELNPAALPGIYDWPLAVGVAGDFEEAPAPASHGARRMPPMRPA